MEKRAIEQILLERSLISREQLDKAIEEAKKTGLPIAKILVRSGIIDEESYSQITAEAMEIPYIDLSSYAVEAEIAKLIPEVLARKYKAMPVFKIGGSLTVAMAEPKDIMAVDDLARRVKCDIEPVLASETSILSAIDQYYGITGSVDEVIKDIAKEKKAQVGQIELDSKKLAEMAGEA